MPSLAPLHTRSFPADGYWPRHIRDYGPRTYLETLSLPRDCRVDVTADPLKPGEQGAPTVTVRVYDDSPETFPRRHRGDLIGTRRQAGAPGFKPRWLVVRKTPSGEYFTIGLAHSSALAARAFVRGMAYAEGIEPSKYVHTFPPID